MSSAESVKARLKNIELLDNLSKQMNVLPDQKELFLFYYNLYYKFSDTE